MNTAGNTGLEMAPFLRNQSFHAVNVIGTLRASVPRAARMFEGAMRFFESAACKAVTPLTVMGFDQVEAGFRGLQSGKNMGKIVFKAEDAAIVSAIPPSRVLEAEFRPDATYVLSGGLGGLGRSLSTLIVSRGAKHLAFLSRSGTKRPEAAAQIDALLAQGIDARAYACDIGDAEQVQRAVAQIRDDGMPPIRGVLQAAMSLADAAYTNMTPEQWTLSVNPKAAGTWNLHQHMPQDDLDFFVMLASSSGAAGNRGQANYAAGNTFQDALAHHRRARGLVATAIDVGPVLGAGHVAENPELIASLAAQGYTALYEDEFLSLIQAAITGVTVTHAAAATATTTTVGDGRVPMPVQLVTGFATGGLVAAEGWEMPYYLEDPKMRHLILVDSHGAGGASDGTEAAAGLASQIADITSVGAGADLVAGALTQKLAKLMMVSPDDIDVNKAVSTYGVDSLTAVEIRAWSFRELQSDISIFDIMTNVPISTLARMIVSKSKLVAKEVVAADG
jgi:short-subunit dehydrogenase/aryl carrier-like protein